MFGVPVACVSLGNGFDEHWRFSSSFWFSNA
jgi:hypothetical protein